MSNHITNQPAGVVTQLETDLDKLSLPNTSWKGMLKHFGPGLILMMTGVGTSHLITAPVAGGRFEYALLWCIPIAYIFKYYGFEMAFRFTNATGLPNRRQRTTARRIAIRLLALHQRKIAAHRHMHRVKARADAG